LTIEWTLSDFDEVVEYVADLVGSDFKRAVLVAQDITENPSEYSGVQASMTAIKLASYRVRIGVEGSYYKLRSA
jgi:hypothetical protein